MKNKAIDYSHSMQIMWSDKKVRLLWRLGHFINSNGCRRDFNLAVTDMYLRGKMNDNDCDDLRHIIEGTDTAIVHGLVTPRISILTTLINKING